MSTSSSITKHEDLTNREQEVIEHLAKGAKNKAIANSLNISIKTVEFHISNILKKLGRNSRAEVIVWLFQYQPDAPDTTKD